MQAHRSFEAFLAKLSRSLTPQLRLAREKLSLIDIGFVSGRFEDVAVVTARVRDMERCSRQGICAINLGLAEHLLLTELTAWSESQRLKQPSNRMGTSAFLGKFSKPDQALSCLIDIRMAAHFPARLPTVVFEVIRQLEEPIVCAS